MGGPAFKGDAMGKSLSKDFSTTSFDVVPRRAGTFCISRDLWNDPIFSKSQMSPREAYIWMTKEASWKPRVVRVAGRVVSLQRGQFAGSSRFLASQFKWSESRVRRYFGWLEKQRRIQRTTDAGINVITLLDYKEIQFPIHDGDAGCGIDATHGRRKQEEVRKNIGKDLPETDIMKADQAGGCSSPQSDRQQITDANVEEHGSDKSAGIIGRLKQALGLAPEHNADFWCDQSVMSHVENWRKLGLNDDQIITEAKASRTKNPEVPNGPKALDRWMRATVRPMGPKASDRSGPSTTVTPRSLSRTEEELRFYADWINGDGHLPSSTIKNTLAYALLQSKLVTHERLRARGVSI